MVIASIVWRRIDRPGHDACRLHEIDIGWRLDGTARFKSVDGPARLAYSVTCDREWHTCMANVAGWIGSRCLDVTVERVPGGVWFVNDEPALNRDDCIDVDLGFTPATNLLPIRRLALGQGEAADAPAAWLDGSAWTLEMLPQRYERRTATEYWYEAPTAEYAALIETKPDGLIRRYPQLWVEVQI